MWYILGNVPCALENIVCSAAVDWNVLHMSAESSWFIVLFKSSNSLLIFCRMFYPFFFLTSLLKYNCLTIVC